MNQISRRTLTPEEQAFWLEAIRIADMPDLGAVTDLSSFVGEHAGSGRFMATAIKAYLFGNLPTGDVGLPSGALWNNGGFICIVR